MAETAASKGPKITDAAVERLRRRIGIPIRWGGLPRNTYSSLDSIREFTIGYGDDNPLFTDPEYAETTGWSTLLAPPMYFMSTGVRGEVKWTDEQAEAMSGGDPMRGVGQYLTSERWAFVRPVTPGIRLRQKRYLHDVEVRESAFGGGRVVVQTHRVEYTDDEDRLFAVNERSYHHADRKASGDSGKYRELQIVPYTEEQLEEIGRAYDAEWRRGPEKLLVIDVSVGSELPKIVKGPLTTTDIICYHVGIGWGGVTTGPLKLAHKNQKRKPGFYTRNSLNVFDVAQRCHWEQDYAQELGHPAAYDYGAMRTNWMVHLLTNWMGDDAWISRLSARARRFNYIGDTQWMQGRVERVEPSGSSPSVDIAVEGINQRGETTFTGDATILLCDSDGARPVLPELRVDDLPDRL
jgi:acyl dehydratase